MQLFKLACLPVLANIVPGEIAAIHGYIYSMRQGLGKGQRAAKVEEPVGTAELKIGRASCRERV